MRAHQIMTRQVITATVDTPIAEAARTLLNHHISGMPVVDAAGKLVGVVSQGDFMRRAEIGTGGEAGGPRMGNRRPGWVGGHERGPPQLWGSICGRVWPPAESLV